jgi:hypothetical protein
VSWSNTSWTEGSWDAVTPAVGRVSLDGEAERSGAPSASSSAGTPLAGVNCGAGVEASVRKSGVVPCLDVLSGESREPSAEAFEAPACKSGVVTVPCRDAATGDAAEKSGEAPDAPLLSGSRPRTSSFGLNASVGGLAPLVALSSACALAC